MYWNKIKSILFTILFWRNDHLGAIVFYMLCFMAYMIYNEPTFYLNKYGIIRDPGCVYKPLNRGYKHGCSVEILWNDGGVTREIIRFGVLLDDGVEQYCRDAWDFGGMKYTCYITREGNNGRRSR